MACATPVTKQMLDDALAAYGQLMMGAAVTEYRDSNGEIVRYARADAGKLLGYINWLKSELGCANPAATGPMRVWM